MVLITRPNLLELRFRLYSKKHVLAKYRSCGCLEPDDPMGKGKASEGRGPLTEDDLKLMAEKVENEYD